jgi:hypothetical protein
MPRIQQYLTTGDIWTYPQRTLTITKFPFWSAIITATQNDFSIAAGATVNVDVQPPAGETWWICFIAGLQHEGTGTDRITLCTFDGTTEGEFTRLCNAVISTSYFYQYGLPIDCVIIITNSKYLRAKFYSVAGTTGNYCYSGYKLSKPQWTPTRAEDEVKPWIKPTEQPIPDMLKPLSKHIVDVWDGVQRKYVQAILLEKDTVLAVEPTSGFPVERMTAYIDAETFTKRYTEFKADPDSTGYRKYFKKWAEEGISI